MNDLISNVDDQMRASRAYQHPFLDQMCTKGMDRQTASRFAVQWFKAATAHKKSFPGLIYNSDNDDIRLGLINILDEEYGFGDPAEIHSRLLGSFLTALGIAPEQAHRAAATPGVTEFGRRVDEYWLGGAPKFAYGVHYALEFLAANMHKAFFSGVSRLGLPDESVRYFRLHSTVEDEHAEKARAGLLLLASEGADARRVLEDGIRCGTELVGILLDGLEDACGNLSAEAVH